MQFQQDRDFENLAFAFGANNAPLATLKTRGNWAELTFAMTSGTVTSVTSPVAIPETIAGHILAPVPFSFLKWRIGCLRSIVSCWDNVSRISDDAKLFPHRPIITVSFPRNCFCLVTQRSWGGVLSDETKTAVRETSYGTVRCLLSLLFFESLFLCIWCSRRGLKTVPGLRSLYFSAFI